MKIYCQIPEVFKGFRELERFNNAASEAWSKKGDFFPMYDEVTGEIFECAWNAQHGMIVAYRQISVEEFRSKLHSAAEELIKARVQLAIQEASAEAAELYRIAECAKML